MIRVAHVGTQERQNHPVAISHLIGHTIWIQNCLRKCQKWVKAGNFGQKWTERVNFHQNCYFNRNSQLWSTFDTFRDRFSSDFMAYLVKMTTRWFWRHWVPTCATLIMTYFRYCVKTVDFFESATKCSISGSSLIEMTNFSNDTTLAQKSGHN